MSASFEKSGPDLRRGVALDTLREDQPLLGHVDDEAVLLVRRGAEIHAVSAACTHYGGPLAEGLVAGDTIRCPWHHACFSLRSGAVVGPPGLNPLRCWQVNVQGGLVRVGDVRPAPVVGNPPRQPQAVLIVGAGAAGEAAATELRNCGYDGPITLLAGEADTPIDRPNLSKDYLAGKAPADWLSLRGTDYSRERDITLVNARALSLDRHERRVRCDDGRDLTYDALLLATGAQPIRLAIPGADLPHVHTLRTRADAEAILAVLARGARRVVVIGASFIGLEAAASLRAHGIEVHVVAPEAHPLERVFGLRLAGFVRSLHEALGSVFHLGRRPASIDAHGVTLDNGEILPADLVIMGVGVRPDTALATQAGLRVDDGIVVDAGLAAAAGIWAAGDVANWPDARSGARLRIEHWTVAQAQGKTAARNMLGFAEVFTAVPFFWSQHGDVTLSYVGHAAQWDAIEEEGDPVSGSYLARYLLGGRVQAVVSIGRDLDSLRAELAMQNDSPTQPPLPTPV
jgi:3-phenylpropionate/trans-cinnamate dioxygenase ferredoxin reductase subunit